MKVVLSELGLHTLRHERTKAVRWFRMEKVEHSSKATIRSLTDRVRRMLHESRQICTKFQQQFVELFRMRGVSGMGLNFTSYFDGKPCLSAMDA